MSDLLSDIEKDETLKSAAVLCFTETWLTPHRTSPRVANNHIVMRCDRISGDNKGGVLISVHQSMPASETTCRVSGIHIEAVSATLILPNQALLQVTVVYRSPSVPMNVLLDVLSSILNKLPAFDIPSVMLGDFNDDLLASLDML